MASGRGHRRASRALVGPQPGSGRGMVGWSRNREVLRNTVPARLRSTKVRQRTARAATVIVRRTYLKPPRHEAAQEAACQCAARARSGGAQRLLSLPAALPRVVRLARLLPAHPADPLG